ncbi:uncharacterized protein LOC125814342 [Solanum verrucosum]|uniref:uncharacterized protein LOC125814342 n=1 Tax=Solanum verrucosum TaxID=315347 RepID=UPI0020D07A31|nr:uncharacterized protein LOC125814342 [Solanum verrucosum]
MAEYEACILGLKMTIDMNVHELLVIGDSDLLIHQKLCKRFRKIEFRHTPRTQNELADALATIASMIKHPDTSYIDPVNIEVKEQPVHCSYVEAEPDGLPWRTPDLDLHRCVDASEAAKLLEQIHAGVCGTHMNGLTLSRKKCHKCQVHGDLIRVPPHELNVMSSSWPFVAWGMDVIGPIEPAAYNGHRFILVTIGYFIKWVEAASYKSVTKKVVADFVRNNLIYRFGVPESIITDNEMNLNSHLIREICEQFKITHQNSTAYRPQMNGAVEAANKNIKKILRKMIDNCRGWHEMLPYYLLGYRTTVRTSVGATPYLLLTLIDEKRMVVVCQGQLYRQRMICAFHKKVRARIFGIGQLVLKHIFPHQDEYKGKFAPNWQGPYMVRKVLSGGALVLSEMDGIEWLKPINSDTVKRYYRKKAALVVLVGALNHSGVKEKRCWWCTPETTVSQWREKERGGTGQCRGEQGG